MTIGSRSMRPLPVRSVGIRLAGAALVAALATLPVGVASAAPTPAAPVPAAVSAPPPVAPAVAPPPVAVAPPPSAPPASSPLVPAAVAGPTGAPEQAPSSPSPPVEPMPPAPVAEALPPTFEAAPDHSPPPVQPAATASDDALRVGVILGLLSFPRPLELELAFKVGRWFGFGVEASYLPELSAPSVDAKLDLKAMQGVFRWYPFGGVFFLGAGLGYQNFQASFGETIDNGHLNVTADMSGAFFIPQVGWMFITGSGFSFGINLGLQIPIPKEPVVTATYNGQPVPAQATSSVPQDVINRAQTNVDNVRSVAKFIVRYPFPEIDFLRLGLFF